MKFLTGALVVGIISVSHLGFGQGLDDEFINTLRVLDRVPEPQGRNGEVKIDYKNYWDGFWPKDTPNRGYKNEREYVLLRIYFLPKAHPLFQKNYVEVGNDNDNFKNFSWGANPSSVREKYEHQLATLGTEQQAGPITIQEAITFHRYNNRTNADIKDQDLTGGKVAVHFREIISNLVRSEVALHMGVSAERSYGQVEQLREPGIRELETLQGRMDIVAPWWLIESIYRNQTIDNADDFYETQNTIALHWTPFGGGDDLDGDGSADAYFSNPSGQRFSQHSWILIGGIQHMRENLNPRDILGVLLSARLLSPYGDNTKGNAELSFFWAPEGYTFRVKLVAGFRDMLDSVWIDYMDEPGSSSRENKWLGLEIFVSSLDGELGEEQTFGSALNFEMDF